MNSAVLDSGPLIHLSELGVLDVLSDFEVLYVLPVVWEEVNEYQPQALISTALQLTRTESPMIDTGLTMLTQALSLD